MVVNSLTDDELYVDIYHHYFHFNGNKFLATTDDTRMNLIRLEAIPQTRFDTKE
jgi:hypothetical protein